MAEPELRDYVKKHGPSVSVVGLFLFMVWVRIRPADRVVTESTVRFSGNDPWYHARMVQYIVRFFPSSPDFDPYSYFPYGTGRHSGFGSIFDQLISFAALLVGFGDPAPHQVEVVTAYAPVVFGALTVVPAYLVARELTDRWSALLAAGLLALVNGQFLTRTIVGVSDHQSAEAFFGTLALIGFLVAIKTAYVEQPTVADLQDRNWTVLRRPVWAGVIGGIAIAAYLMMWSPGVFLVFTFGIFVVIQLSREHLRGASTEYLSFASIVSMLTAAVLTLLYAKTYTITATGFSLLQPLVLVGIAVGTGGVWRLSELFRDREIDAERFPLAVGGVILGTVVAAGIIYPPVLSMLKTLITRVYSFGLLTTPAARTVAEIAPATPSDAWQAYSALFPLAILGLLVLVVRIVRENRPIELLVVLWSLSLASAYFTMIRFGYYMGVVVALLAGFAIWYLSVVASLNEVRTLSDLETYQVLIVLILVVAVVPGNVIAVGGTSPPVWQTAETLGGANSPWQSELGWVRENTPGLSLDYYDQYERPLDGDFEYPADTYGVMSWWDYGHWITYTGHRIPNANPFQQGPQAASAFLLAQNETRANLILEALPSIDSPSALEGMTNAELRSAIAEQNSQEAAEDTRYVMIDDQMAAGKFSAIATWTGPGPGAFFSREEFRVGNSRANLIGTNQRYEDTMLARLYFQDARGLSHYRLVHETGDSIIVSVARQTPSGFESTNFINRRLNSQVFAAVQQRQDLFFYDDRRSARVKTFERVPGAIITGQIDTANTTTVIATLQLQTNRGRNFTYVQSTEIDSDGRFELTVPYATNEALSPSEGGTDSGVVARGVYEIYVGDPAAPLGRANVSVPEPAIYEGSTITVDIDAVNRTSASESTGEDSNGSALGHPSTFQPDEEPLLTPRERHSTQSTEVKSSKPHAHG